MFIVVSRKKENGLMTGYQRCCVGFYACFIKEETEEVGIKLCV
jgi:hypothetical protein